MEKKILIFPYSDMCDIFIEQIEDLENIDELYLVCFKGWGYEGKKISFKGKEISVITDFDFAFQNSDEIWFVDTEYNLDESTLIYPKVNYAHACGKTIRYYGKETSMLKKELKGTDSIKEETDIPKILEVMNTPLVVTAGLYDDNNEMQVELSVYEMLHKTNFNVVYIGSQRYGKALGMYEFPEFMFDNKYANLEKVLLFNQYIKEIENEKKPDLIIVGVPGGVSSYSREIVGDFGILFDLVSISVSTDIFVLSVPYEDYNIYDIQNLRKYVWERYKIHTDFFNIMPKKVNVNITNSSEQLRYLTVNNNRVMKKIEDLASKDIFCLKVKSERNKLTKKVIDRLMNYGKIELL